MAGFVDLELAPLFPVWFGIGLFALLGLIVGSFLATLCLRWPEGRSVLGGRSACDACGHTLGPSELVPVLSAIASRGRCRACGAPIARFHTYVELTAAAIGALPFILAPPAAAMGWALLGWLLLPLAILDIRHLWLPNALVGILAIGGVIGSPLLVDVSWTDRGIGAVAGLIALWLIARLYHALRGREGLGAGDAKLFGALGFWFGWQMLPLLLLLASTVGIAAALLLGFARGGVDRMTALPFGAFLAAAAWLLPFWWLTGWAP